MQQLLYAAKIALKIITLWNCIHESRMCRKLMPPMQREQSAKTLRGEAGT